MHDDAARGGGTREEAQLATFLEELESAGFELARWRSGAGASRGLDFAALDATETRGGTSPPGCWRRREPSGRRARRRSSTPSSGDWRSGTRVRIVVGDARAETRVSRSSSLVHGIISSRNERVVARIRWFYSSIFLSLVRRDGVAVYSAGRWYTSGSSLASTGARGVCPASVCDPPPKQAKKSPRPYGRPGTSSRTRSPWVTTTREARPRGSRSDSRRRRGASEWSRSCAGSRGAQPEERERPARARGGRVSVGGGDGGCGPGRGSFGQTMRENLERLRSSATVPSREARGKRSESGSRATHLRPRDWTSRRSCPSRATRRWCRARRRRPRGSRVDGRGEKWAPPRAAWRNVEGQVFPRLGPQRTPAGLRVST